MSQHTPGPWVRKGSGSVYRNRCIAKNRDFELVAEVLRDADARLIAAAPVLLETLEATEAYLPVALQDRARAAIRAAKGESNGS